MFFMIFNLTFGSLDHVTYCLQKVKAVEILQAQFKWLLLALRIIYAKRAGVSKSLKYSFLVGFYPCSAAIRFKIKLALSGIAPSLIQIDSHDSVKSIYHIGQE